MANYIFGSLQLSIQILKGAAAHFNSVQMNIYRVKKLSRFVVKKHY